MFEIASEKLITQGRFDMAGKIKEEVFELDPKFVKGIYNFFLNKYARDTADFSVLDLIKDLQTRLSCRATALLQHNEKTDNTAVLYESDEEPDLLGEVLKDLKVKEKIYELLRDDRYSGGTVTLDTFEILGRKAGQIEVDLIPMPRLPDSQEFPPYDHLFILVDSAAMTPSSSKQSDQHELQRISISDLLCSWWVRALTPNFSTQNKKESGTIGDEGRFKSLWLGRRYITTPSALIKEGVRSADFIRSIGQGKAGYFLGECEKEGNDDGKFEWNKWTPLKPGRDNLPGSDNLVMDVRERGKMLVYWCRWIESHHHFEREQASSTLARTHPKKEGKTVKEWVDKQRKNIKNKTRGHTRPYLNSDDLNIQVQLEQLHKKAAEEFLAIIVVKDQKMLQIDSKSMLAFSLNHWLAPGSWLLKNLKSDSFADIEFCRAMHSLAITTHFIFIGQRIDEDDVIHRLVQLLAQYGHGELHIPFRVDLRAHLLQAARGEPALHALKHYYRDHFFHAIEVCFLGHALLETKLREDLFLWQLVAEILCITGEQSEIQERVLRLWYMAALLHDIGYAMDLLNSSRDYLKFFKHSETLRNLCESFSDAVKKLSDAEELEKVGISKERRKKEDQDADKKHGIGEDHGVIGALHLQTLLEHIAVEDKSLWPGYYEPAIQAIALHNLRRREDGISFKEKPLAFLLALCDQLQEWRRPQLEYATSPHLMLAKLSGASGDTDRLKGAFKYLWANLEGQLDDKGNIQLKFQPGVDYPHLSFIMDYGEKINRNSGVFNTWLDATLNFQRLNFDGLPLEISVSFKTPFYKDPYQEKPYPQQQLHRLRNAAHETHMSFLWEWFPRDENRDGSLTNGAVTYEANQDEQRETLTLDLRKLSLKPLMTKNMDAFRERLKEWKHFNDDREFPGDYVNAIPD
jgi:hypothetical protein